MSMYAGLHELWMSVPHGVHSSLPQRHAPARASGECV
jgi:hypothetical protein